MKDQLFLTVEEKEWHRRKTCAPGPHIGREGADYDAEPGHDYDQKHLRGTTPCVCGGWARYELARSHDGTHWYRFHEARCNRCHIGVLCEEGESITNLIARWNARQTQLRCAHSWFRVIDQPACGNRFRCLHCGEEMGR